MAKSRKTWVIVAAASLVPVARGAISFNLIGLSSIAPAAATGFQQAANRWANTLDATDSGGNSFNITINLQVGFSSLGSTTLGESAATTATVSYSSFKAALLTHATSADDLLADASLPAGNSFSVELNRTTNDPAGSGSAILYVDNMLDLSQSHVTNSVRATYANLRALGLKPANDSAVDAQIIFSSDFPFDFTPGDGIDAGKTDFVGVATHEIGHALGFGSGSTDLDYSVGHSGLVQDQDMLRVRPLDLFRYSTASSALGAIDLSADTRSKYFSLDHGVTSIANFSTGLYFGDGFQASHWAEQSPTLGIMDPGIAPGEKATINSLDRRAFDVIGYKVLSIGKWTDTSSSSTARWSNASQWSVDGVPDGTISAVFANNANYIVSVDTVSIAKDITVGNDNVTFSLTSANLNSGTVSLGQSAGDAATLTVQRTAAGQFNCGNINIGAVAGSAGTLNVQGGVIVSSGTLTIGAASGANAAVSVSSGTLTAMTATVNGAYTQSGGMVSLGAVSGTGAMNVTGGTLSASNISLVRLTVANAGKIALTGSGGVSRVASLSITGAGQIDLSDHDLIVDYTGTPPTAAISSYLSSAYNCGSWNGAGIASSAAGGVTALGYGLAGDVGIAHFDGQAVGQSILVKYTYVGDSSLDGKVDLGNDFNLFLQGFLATNASSWELGDYNYDGVVNTADFQLFVDGFKSQGGTLGDLDGVIANSPALSIAQRTSLLAAVPEPTLLSAIPMVIAMFQRRRRAGFTA